MGYDSNGFNFKDESILNTYDTTITTIPTKSSGFSKNSTDIATLITPAMTGGRGNTDIGNAYKGFSGQITFDNAFSSQTPSKPLLALFQSTSGSSYNPWNSVEFKNPAADGWFEVTFSKTLSNGSASTPNDFYIPEVKMKIVMVGGGGSGGSTGTVQGAGGGGAGGVHELDFQVYADSKKINVKIGSGGSSVGGHARGNHGNLTSVGGTTDNEFYIEAVAGGGGGYFGGTGHRTDPGASTGGAGASSGGNTAANYNYADDLTTNGNKITRYGDNAGVKIISETDHGRNKGGSDPGYGLGGGGGGGAGSAGVSNDAVGDYNRKGGNGGNGVGLYGKTYGGGGGAHGEYNSGGNGTGGSGVGGDGGQSGAGGNGTANTGSGGGAGWGLSGAGGSGVVRLFYRTSQVRTS